MAAVTWGLIAVGILAVAVCAVHVHHTRGPPRAIVVALPIAAALALPALLPQDAPARLE
ncbi:hypothetical protein ABT173_28055 [Streptomyces sp. NPDC001795]|uniref:hypothetical protein n=1 Tax=unclassified Streptomyces TaxID=2593676 RepID=UPI0033193BA9